MRSRALAETQKEARFLLKCRHPNILLMMGMVVLDDGPALIMERYDCTLAVARATEAPSTPYAVRVLTQVSSAVAYLHEIGICHRAIRDEHVPARRGFFGEI